MSPYCLISNRVDLYWRSTTNRGFTVYDSCSEDQLTSHPLLDPFIFISSFEADQIHTAFAAVVPCVKPIPVGRSNAGVV